MFNIQYVLKIIGKNKKEKIIIKDGESRILNKLPILAVKLKQKKWFKAQEISIILDENYDPNEQRDKAIHENK